MRIYLAGAFSLKERVEHVAAHLRSLGHTIPDEWWHHDFKTTAATDSTVFKAIAARHWAAIQSCDAVVLVCPPTHMAPHRFTGANVEVGYAIAKDIPVLSVGSLEVSAMYDAVIKCPTASDLDQALKILDYEPTRPKAVVM